MLQAVLEGRLDFGPDGLLTPSLSLFDALGSSTCDVFRFLAVVGGWPCMCLALVRSFGGGACLIVPR